MKENVSSRTALVHCYIEAKRWKDGDLAAYHGAKYAAMSKAFGIDFDDSGSGGMDPTSGLMSLFGTAAERYLAISSPFADYIEATRAMAEMYQVHGQRVEGGCDAARSAILGLMCDVLVAAAGEDPHTFSSSDLKDLTGFEDIEPPDPLDYL